MYLKRPDATRSVTRQRHSFLTPLNTAIEAAARTAEQPEEIKDIQTVDNKKNNINSTMSVDGTIP